ncbi:MAG: glycosyltransferase family 87 protein [Polyangiales bacterium]
MLRVYEALYRPSRFVLIAVVTLTVVWTATDRFTPPETDRFVEPLWPGSADFYIPWAAARALRQGSNPYLTPLGDPWNRRELVDGQMYYLLYPPAMVTLYLPLAYYTDSYFIAAKIARVWHFMALAAIAFATWTIVRIVRRSLGHPHTEPVVGLLLFCCMALCSQTSLALERGQSDITVALLCWLGVLALFYKHTFTAVFLATAATAVKGYPILFGMGIGLLALVTQSWWRAIAGALSAVAVLLYPVRDYVVLGMNAARFRSNLVCHEWRNYAFSQFVWQWWPDDPFMTSWGRLLLTFFCGTVALACLVQALRSDALSRPRWVLLFSLMSLTTMVGYSACGYVYSFIMLAPGILAFFVAAPELLAAFGWSRIVALTATWVQVPAAFWLFASRLDDHMPVSATADGLVAFVLLNGTLLLIGLIRGQGRPRLIPHDEL